MYFEYNESYYLFRKIKEFDYNYLNQISKYDFNKIIKNKYNMFLSYYDNELYVLLKINNKKNRIIELDDLINIYTLEINISRSVNNIFNLWKNKNDFLEKYYKEKYDLDRYDFYYFKGLSELSLRIIKSINIYNIRYGISFNRFYEVKTIFDLYDPFNSKYSIIVNSFSEFIKYEYFYNNNRVDYLKILDLDLNKEELYYLIAKLLFPTYYYDLLKNNEIENKYGLIIDKTLGYLDYLKEIIMTIKKRHSNMPFLDQIVNLL